MLIVECYPGRAILQYLKMFMCILVYLLTNGAVADSSESDDATPLIFNGSPATIEQHPHLVSFQTKKGHFCGGAILDKNIILTAAHCFSSGNGVKGVEVVAGRTKQSQYSKTEQLFEIENVIMHQKHVKLEHDIALVKTRKEFQWRRQVRPAMIAMEWDNTNASITVAGWGVAENNRISDDLLEADMKIAENKKCASRWPKTFKPDNTFCIYEPKKDTCEGDSGSPVLNSNGEVIGVVSYGTPKCGKFESVATNVTHYLKWIEQTMKEMTSECKSNSATATAILEGSEVPLEDLIRFNKRIRSDTEIQKTLCGSNSVFRCFNTTCYCYLANKLRLTYLQSLIICHDFFNGSFASTFNSEEDHFLHSLLETKRSGLWLKHRLNQSYTGYTKWGTNETKNTSIICGILDGDLSWHETSCLQSFQSVCQIPYTKGKCKPGWASFRGHCYHINGNHLTWHDAEQNCGKAHNYAYLASVFDSDENIFINNLLRMVGENKAWIGQYKRPNNSFRWSDETETNFTRLDPLQKQSEDSENEECVLFGVSDYPKQARWRVSPCTALYSSVCKTRHES